MPVVTIRGQMGSGAPEIGKQIATMLNVDYVDRRIIEDVSGELKWPNEAIANKEMPPGSLLGRIAEALGRGYAVSAAEGTYAGAYLPAWQMPLQDNRYLSVLESVIKELAASNAIVIRGRGSQFILRDVPGTFHVLVVARFDLRLQRVMETTNLDETAARKEIERFDSSRREFTKRYFNAELEDAANYDLVINTEHFSFDHASSIVVNALPLNDKIPGLTVS